MQTSLQNLLALQVIDVQWIKAQQLLGRMPLEIKALEEQIKEVEGRLAETQGEIKRLELAAKECSGEFKSAQEQLLKFKVQQGSVKKNEEYNALNLQIASTTEKMDELESKEIEVLLEIDTAQEAFGTLKGELDKEIAQIRSEIKAKEEDIAKAQMETDTLGSEVEVAKERVPEVFLSAYESLRSSKVKAPFVVELEDQKCSGCHLRVSNESGQDSHGSDKPHFCEHCGRMIYSALPVA